MRPLALLIGAALCGGSIVAPLGGPLAHAEGGGAAILEVIAIKASKDPGVFDPRLISLTHDLESLPYASFTLLAARA